MGISLKSNSMLFSNETLNGNEHGSSKHSRGPEVPSGVLGLSSGPIFYDMCKLGHDLDNCSKCYFPYFFFFLNKGKEG